MKNFKKMSKACLAFVLSAGMVLTGVQIPQSQQTVIADETQQEDFVIENGVLTKYTGTSPHVVIPDGVEVISGAFYWNEKIETVYIPDSVHTIEDYAFWRCSNLCEVRFSEGLKVLGVGAFAYTAIQEADLSKTEITAVGINAFQNCGELTYAALPDTVLTIGKSAFENDVNLSECVVNEGVVEIGAGAFGSCGKLEEIYLPTTLRSIGSYAFSGCETIQKLVVPEGIETLTEGVFYGLNSLTDITLPQSLKSIQSRALAGGQSLGEIFLTLKKITIPAGVESIANSAFAYCALTNVYGAAGSEAESYFTDYENGRHKTVSFEAVSLELPTTSVDTDVELPEISLEYEGRNSDFNIVNGILCDYTGTENVVIVPDGVTKIDNSAFNDNKTAIRIVLPEGVEAIGDFAFSGCHALQEIVLPSTLKTIGTSAFQDCFNLLKLQLPDSVTVIPEKMCFECPSLLQLEFGNAITKISNSAFDSANGSATTPVVHSLKFPETLTEIGDSAFPAWDGLVELELPDSLTSIGSYAFYKNYALTEVSIPAGVKVLSTKAFADNILLKSLHLQNGLEELGSGSFVCTYKLTSVYIPKSVKKAGTNLFGTGNNTSSITTIYGEKGSYAQTDIAENYNIAFSKLTEDEAKAQDALANQKKTPLPKAEKKEPEKKPEKQEKEYISITTAKQLDAIRNDLDGNYRLDADIDLTNAVATGGSLDVNGFGWLPIGVDKDSDSFSAFTGTFDGNGHSISGLSIRGNSNYTINGLFGAVDGTVKNLTLKNCDIEVYTNVTRGAGRAYGAIAGVVGYGSDEALIENCTVEGTVCYLGKSDITEDGLSIGGITGQLLSGTITDTQNRADILYKSTAIEYAIAPANHTIGGICGFKQAGDIINCSNIGTIMSNRALFCKLDLADELGGTNDYIQDIVDSIMGSGGIQIYNYTGGICGYAQGAGIISTTYNKGNVTNKSAITFKGYSLKIQRGFTEAGGIVGSMYSATRLYDCYNTGDIFSDCNIDSWISIIEDEFFDVQAPSTNNYSYAAGIVGTMNNGLIKRCFNTGTITGKEEQTYGIANGSGVVAYCRYIGSDSTNKGFTAYDDSLRRCKSMTTEESSLFGVMVNDTDTYRRYGFGDKWILGGSMEYPQLIDNMESEVTGCEWTGTTPAKTAYDYAQGLDTDGLKVNLTLAGNNTPITLDILSGRVQGYNSRQAGTQTLTAEIFGKTVSFDVTVAEKIKKSDLEPSPSPSASSAPTESPATSDEPSESPTTSDEPSASPSTSDEPSASPTTSTEPSVSPTTSTEPTESPTVSDTPSEPPTTETPAQGIPGDADLDESVTLNDVLIILKAAVGIESIDQETIAYKNADVDNDGSITLSDCILVLKIAVGIN